LPLTGVRNKVADTIDSKAKIKILDVCTGTGTQAFAFAKRGYEVVGIDLSEEMLRVANKKNKYENVRLYESTYYRDYAKRNLEELLREHGFRIVKEAYGLIDFVEIFVCGRKSLGRKG
jgi:ubiquinone/menaquinone biosynthesis C-methylase UbiE